MQGDKNPAKEKNPAAIPRNGRWIFIMPLDFFIALHSVGPRRCMW